MKILSYLRAGLFFLALLLANGVYWLYCKATGKPFEEFGGPQ